MLIGRLIINDLIIKMYTNSDLYSTVEVQSKLCQVGLLKGQCHKKNKCDFIIWDVILSELVLLYNVAILGQKATEKVWCFIPEHFTLNWCWIFRILLLKARICLKGECHENFIWTETVGA